MLVTTYASSAPLTIDIRPARMYDVYPILGLHCEAFADKFGVAQALLFRAEEDARLRRKRFLGLYVSAANYGARQLYLRTGFVEHRKRRSLLAGWLLHQRIWLYMRKDVV